VVLALAFRCASLEEVVSQTEESIHVEWERCDPAEMLANEEWLAEGCRLLSRLVDEHEIGRFARAGRVG
jgi:hypothetical protein